MSGRESGFLAAREFGVDDVLSVMTGVLVSRDHIGGVYKVCDHMTGESLMTHQLPRAADECAPSLRAQFPDLAAIEMPEFDGEESVFAWLDGIEARYGKTRWVEPLNREDHTRIDPIAELKMIRPDVPIIAVRVDDEGSR